MESTPDIDSCIRLAKLYNVRLDDLVNHSEEISGLMVPPKGKYFYRKQIYISLGTVNNKNINFYKNCIKAFEECEVDVVMSVGKGTDIKKLGYIPNNFQVENSVEQVIVLQNTDVFITHCGMNSVNESLYYGVPMVLFPNHSEQRMVSQRVYDLGAGGSKKAVDAILKVIN